MYAKFFKRPLDFLLSLTALLVLSPLLLLLTAVGSVIMRGNPFFTQQRPGRNEKIFRLIKFRSMTNARDKNGQLLSDNKRLTRYGRILRSTSLDELPELFNIIKGDMALVGPRPLLVEYLSCYTEAEHHRHDVRPGLTGLAQINGRNAQTWKERFQWDLLYIEKITFRKDLEILLRTVFTVIFHRGIHAENSVTMEKYTGS